MSTPPSRRLKVYISYSHKDAQWKDRILEHLKPLASSGRLEFWEDSRIGVGVEWEKENAFQRSQSSVAILLITASFLSSDHIMGTEVPDLLSRRDQAGMLVIPVLVSPCAWSEVDWLRQIQMYPRGA